MVSMAEMEINHVCSEATLRKHELKTFSTETENKHAKHTK